MYILFYSVSFVVEKPQRMSNGVVSETTRLSIIPNNSSSAQKTLLKNLEIINGGQRVNAWVDSMRASSPTHLKSLSSSVSSEKHLSSWIVSSLHIQLSFTKLSKIVFPLTTFYCVSDRCGILQH